jgi:hypothetical protein
MYRQGLGDCFLLTFDPQGTPVHILIDCGSLGATTTGVSLAKVVADIRQTTQDHLHVLIATHEHQDHLSGFNSVKKEFDKIQVDHVWLAWTENPEDGDAKRIKKFANDLGASAGVAARALMKIGRKSDEAMALGEAIGSLLGFFGEERDGLGADFAESVNAAMEYVRTRVPKARHLEPGELVEEPWLTGFRFYILGPPRSEAALNKLEDDDPASLYQISSGLRAGAQAAVNADAFDAGCEEEMPFDRRFRLGDNDPLAINARKRYAEPDAAWRRIDGDWLQSAGSLALQLDSLTNNTSLAFAIERLSDGKVLLFPADGQLGHWLSWHDPNRKWTVSDAGSQRTVTAADLLHATVFYKVGHHASHNATAKEKGLEMMNRTDELVAFIPVDRQVALKRNPPGSWKMPAKGLYRRLLERCQGRVVRSDLGWADDAINAAHPETEEMLQGVADAASWAAYRQAQRAVDGTTVKIGPLFVDYTLT